ncbi:uncharacterized protein LOC125025432 [Penaeus chinensis]|uniref:uncharacterized protein LOC125025432 n=1 Tax=Penaeus chinensis TaxID=139456 RepID=UPI001FB69D6E|nr:uncharacterized protein LOC125025432 [Penaeus chinensis]
MAEITTLKTTGCSRGEARRGEAGRGEAKRDKAGRGGGNLRKEKVQERGPPLAQLGLRAPPTATRTAALSLNGRGGGFAGHLRGLQRLKSQAFTSLRNLKAPFIEGIRNLKSQVLDFKGSLFNKGNLFNKGGGGGQSSYYRRPSSHYGGGSTGSGYGGGGGDGSNGYIQVSYQPPSTGYGAPSAPASNYGAPPSDTYGAPQAPATGYGAPQAPATGYGAPQAPATGYGAPQAPQAPATGYGAPQAPQAPATGYGAPQAPATGYGAPQAGLQANPTGLKAPQVQSSGFRPSAPLNGYSGTGTGQTASRPLQNAYNAGTGQAATGHSGSQAQSHINAPLSAAMAMGHLLKEEEVIKGTGKAEWQPVTGVPTIAPPIDVRAPASVVQNQGTRTQIAAASPAEEPLFIDLTGPGTTGGGANGGVIGGALGETANTLNGLSSDPVVVDDTDDTLLISGTEEYDDILLVDKGSADAAAEALSKVVDAALFIDEPAGKALSGSRPQENVVSVGQTAFASSKGRSSDTLQPGQNSNMMFSGLMEELELSTLMALIRRANLEAMLTTEGGFTIFAPSDSAFSLLPRSVVSRLQNNTDKLREVVLFHVVPGVLRLEDLTDNGMLSSASPKGRKLRVNVFKHGSDLQDVVTINGARVKRHDMIATNGVIHVIDKVLYPMADLSIMDHLTTCETFTGANVAVTGAGLTPVLEQDGPYTVFLPTTEAFAAIDNATVSSFIENITLLQNVLMYHIVPGAYFSEGLRDGTWLPTLAQEQELQMRVTSDGYTRRLAGVGGTANVIKHDIIATNGVIHVIDTVLRPEKETPICGHF